MNPLTLEWIIKAEGDFSVAEREFRVRKNPTYDAVCFHCQQVVEKYLKAILQENNTPIPKTHNLLELLTLCISLDSSFEFLHTDLLRMEGFAVLFRYPGQTAEYIDAKLAIKNCKYVREFIRNKLRIE
jgi:HEPN domain-containing protein